MFSFALHAQGSRPVLAAQTVFPTVKQNAILPFLMLLYATRYAI
jgi:hypothetical protein